MCDHFSVPFFCFIISVFTSDHDTSLYKCTLTASTGGLPQSCQVEASRSLTARSCMTNERQVKDQGKIKGDEKRSPRSVRSSALASSLPLSNASCSSRPLFSYSKASSPSSATGGPDSLFGSNRTLLLHTLNVNLMTGTLGGTVVGGKRTICVHCHDLYRSHANK